MGLGVRSVWAMWAPRIALCVWLRTPSAQRSVCLAGAMLVATGACGHSTDSTSRTSSPSAQGTAFPAGSSIQSLTFGGTQRQFIVYVPSDLPAQGSVPLVVMLHGGFGSATEAERDYGWDELADTAHFIVVYPNGLNHAWNAGGGCCGSRRRLTWTTPVSLPKW